MIKMSQSKPDGLTDAAKALLDKIKEAIGVDVEISPTQKEGAYKRLMRFASAALVLQVAMRCDCGRDHDKQADYALEEMDNVLREMGEMEIMYIYHNYEGQKDNG